MNAAVISGLKWWQTIKVSWSNIMTYRMDFFLQILAPGMIFLFIKYNLWSSIYNGDMTLVLAGHNFTQMIQYQTWALMVLLLTQGHKSLNLAVDIRLGRISSYLIYPMNFWEYHTAGFLAFQIIQSFICLFSLLLFLGFNILSLPSLSALFMGYAYCLLVSFLWYSIQYSTGLLAFWLEETWVVRVMLQIITVFLSGGLMPIDFFPQAFKNFLNYTPFPYLTYYPIKIFAGEITNIFIPSLVVLFWLALGILLNRYLWKKGLKLYTAAGM